MSIGVEKNIATSASTGNGLIRSVTLVESVITGIFAETLIPVTRNAVTEKNNMIILRTIGIVGTSPNRRAQSLTLEDVDLLAVGESVIIKCEQIGGYGNAVLLVQDSANSVIGQFQLAPAGKYLVVRTSDAIGWMSGYSLICLNDGSDSSYEITFTVNNRRVGFGVFSINGGGIIEPQIRIPAANANSTTDKVVVVNYGGLSRIASENDDPIYDSFGSSVTHDIAKGVYIFQYAQNKIYFK